MSIYGIRNFCIGIKETMTDISDMHLFRDMYFD